jgi:hypothetical protein
MNAKIDNLVVHFLKVLGENDLSYSVNETYFSKMVNKKTLDIKEDEFKKFITRISWVSPVDILIMSINCVEKMKRTLNLRGCYKFGILWITCLLSTKYVYAYDNEKEIMVEFWSNLGGFQLEDYVFFERKILQEIDWKLEISEKDYNRLIDISNKTG